MGAGAVALTAALLTVPSAPVSASDERRVEIVRIGGGARLGVGLEDVKPGDVARLALRTSAGRW